MTLPPELLALIHKPADVKQCDFVGKCMASAASYGSSMGYSPSMARIADRADSELAKAWQLAQETHAANLPAIESNRAMRELLMAIMAAAGVPARYSHYGFPSPRSRYKKHMTSDSGFPKDINRAFPVDDGFAGAQQTYERLKADYAKYREAAQREADVKARAVEEEKARRRADMALATLIVRYGLAEDADWSDVLEVIRSRDQYLDLAIAGQQTRGDWSEGFYRVESALGRFRIKDDRDKEIAADICGCLSSEDGRIFRDTRWSYDALFEIVADKQLIEDAQLCLTNIDP